MEKTYTKEELFDEIVRVMGDLFEVDTEGVTRASRLAFKSVRTVGDVVDVIYDFSQQNGEAAK